MEETPTPPPAPADPSGLTPIVDQLEAELARVEGHVEGLAGRVPPPELPGRLGGLLARLKAIRPAPAPPAPPPS